MLFRYRNDPRAAKATTAITFAPENGMLRKSRSSSSGWLRRGSYHTMPARDAAVTANAATIAGDDQPSRGPSMIPQVRLASAAATRTWPTGSNRRGWSALDSGSPPRAAAAAASPIGTLMTKIHRHPSGELTRAPPTTGPSARASPVTPDHTP